MISRNSEKFRHNNLQARKQLSPHQHQHSTKELQEKYTRLSDDDDLMLQRENWRLPARTTQLLVGQSEKDNAFASAPLQCAENFYENLQFNQHRASGGHIYGKLLTRNTYDDSNIYENICETCGGFYSNSDVCDKCAKGATTTTAAIPKRKFFQDLIGNLKLKSPRGGSTGAVAGGGGGGGGTKVKKTVNRIEIVHNVDQVFKTNKSFDLNEICLMKNSVIARDRDCSSPVELRKRYQHEDRVVQCHSDDHLVKSNRRQNIHKIRKGSEANSEPDQTIALRHPQNDIDANHSGECIRSYSDNSNLRHSSNKNLLHLLRDNLAKLKRNSTSLGELSSADADGISASTGNYNNHFVNNSDENLNTIRRKNILYYPQFKELISKEFPQKSRRNSRAINTIYENILFGQTEVVYNSASVRQWLTELKRETADYQETGGTYNIKPIPSRSFDQSDFTYRNPSPGASGRNTTTIGEEFENQITDFCDNLNNINSKRMTTAPIVNSNTINQPIRIILRTPSYDDQSVHKARELTRYDTHTNNVKRRDSLCDRIRTRNEFDIALNDLQSANECSRGNIAEDNDDKSTTSSSSKLLSCSSSSSSLALNEPNTNSKLSQPLKRYNRINAKNKQKYFFLLNNHILSVSLNKITLINDIHVEFHLKYNYINCAIRFITNCDISPDRRRRCVTRDQQLREFQHPNFPQLPQRLKHKLIKFIRDNRFSANSILMRLTITRARDQLSANNNCVGVFTMKEMSDFYKKEKTNNCTTMTNVDGGGDAGAANVSRSLKKRLSDFDLNNKYKCDVNTVSDSPMKIEKFFKCNKTERVDMMESSVDHIISANKVPVITVATTTTSTPSTITTNTESIYQPIWKCKTDGEPTYDYGEQTRDSENIYAELSDFRKQTDDDEWEISDDFDYSADKQQLDDFINNNVMLREKSDVKIIPLNAHHNLSSSDYSRLCILFNTARPDSNRIFYNHKDSDLIPSANFKNAPDIRVFQPADLVKNAECDNVTFDDAAVIAWQKMLTNAYYADDEEDVIMADELQLFKERSMIFEEIGVIKDKIKSNKFSPSTKLEITPVPKDDATTKSTLSPEKPAKSADVKTPSPKLGLFKLNKSKNDDEDKKSLKSENGDDSDKGSGKLDMNSDIPRFVVECIQIIGNDENIVTHGLYRASGNKTSIENIIKKISDKKAQKSSFKYSFLKKEDVHSLTGALKQYFRNLPDPLIPDDLFQNCIRPNYCVKDISDSIKKLEIKNREILKFVIKHLQAVSEKHAENMMTAANLSIVWSASLFSSHFNEIASFDNNDIVNINNLVLELINNYVEIFEN